MKLNEEQIGIIRTARELYDGLYTGYICIAIGEAGWIAMRSGNDDHDLKPGSISRFRVVTLELERQVQGALRGLYVMEKWVYEETGFRIGGDDTSFEWDEYMPKRPIKYVSKELFREYMVMARMAWLDKIIESGEIS